MQTRLQGYDVARCLAILAMVFVNFEVVLALGADAPTWLRTLAGMCEGNASALFVTLAGCGLVLLGRRTVILKRALFLVVIGYAWQVLWTGDILHYYAFYLLFGALALRLPAAALWGLAAIAMGGFCWAFWTLDYGAGWDWTRLEYVEFWSWGGQARNLLFNGWHPLLPWLGFLFAGMAIQRGGIHTPKARRIAMAASAAVYGLSFAASHSLTQLEDSRPWLDQLEQWYRAPQAFWAMASIPPGPLYMLSAGATAVFTIALCLELASVRWIERVAQPLAATGQLALTFYLAHVLVLFFVVEPMLAAGSERPPLEFAAWAALWFNLGAIVFATLWRLRFRRGPLEVVMRKICG